MTKTKPDKPIIYIGNLPKNSTLSNLQEIFSPYGNISHCRFAINPIDKQQMDFAFIHLDPPEISQHATDQINGEVYQGKVLLCKIVEQ